MHFTKKNSLTKREELKNKLKSEKILKNTALSINDYNRLNNFLKRKGFYWDNIMAVFTEWGIL